MDFTLQAFHDAFILVYNVLIVPVALFSTAFFLIAIYNIRQKRAARPRQDEPKEWPSVTVQIPTKNETVALRCAKKCLEFDYPQDRFNIIIGDDSNRKSVSSRIDSFAKEHPGKVIVTRRGSNTGYKAGNLNHMLKHSAGEIIVIFDSDFTPESDFLKRIVKPMAADRKVAYVQARWGYSNMAENRVSKFASGILMVYHKLLAPINEKLGVSLLFGSGEAVRKDALLKLGGWKEWSMTEDVEFSLKALKAGYRAVYLQDLNVNGEVPFTVRGLAKQQKRWSYGNTRAFLQNARWILFGSLPLKKKLALSFTLVGYISAPILILFTLLGFAVWFSGTPGVIDFYRFFAETGKTILVSSGFLFAMLVALYRENRLRLSHSVVGASLTIGFVVSMSVFHGLLKAFSGRRMQWYMIEKKGNQA